MLRILEATANHLRMTKRLAARRGTGIRERLGRLDDRLVFVVGSPRSGTTFLAGAIGALPDFVDLGEVPPLKAAVPELAALEPREAARRLRQILVVARRAGLVGTVRPVEQTPELAHLVSVIPLAYPDARIVHIVRDGRDVVCSLLEKPWLRRAQVKTDDAGLPYGAHARFWVELDRRAEFEAASDARRAAWVWRRYVTAVRAADAPVLEIRYERMSAEPEAVAEELGNFLDAPTDRLASELSRAHGDSVGRYQTDLDDAQLTEVLAEAGELLGELGYLVPLAGHSSDPTSLPGSPERVERSVGQKRGPTDT